jgi:hypothetical protein
MRLDTKFSPQNTAFNSFFEPSNSTFNAKFNANFSYIGGEKYEGNYEVVPKIQEQKLLTKNKLLTDDVTIKSIPVVKVSNTSGGNTVIIGG